MDALMSRAASIDQATPPARRDRLAWAVGIGIMLTTAAGWWLAPGRDTFGEHALYAPQVIAAMLVWAALAGLAIRALHAD